MSQDKTVAIIHQHHVTAVLVVFGVLVLTIVLLIWPAMSGHTIKKQFSALGSNAEEVLSQIEGLKTQVAQAEGKVAICEQVKQEFASERETEKSATLACNEQLRKRENDLQIELQNKDSEIRQISGELEELQSDFSANLTAEREQNIQLQDELDVLQATHLAVVKSAANNICCKNRFDNPAIDSYRVVDGKIVCSTGQPDLIVC